MLPRENRLKRMKDFEILFKEGVFVGGKNVALKIWKIDPKKYPRREYDTSNLLIGFVVGKKIAKSAVKRNRVKRQMREAVRLLLKKNKVKSGYMMLVMATSGVLDADYDEIEKNVMVLFKKARILKE
jgi:ribonuclease P protein component